MARRLTWLIVGLGLILARAAAGAPGTAPGGSAARLSPAEPSARGSTVSTAGPVNAPRGAARANVPTGARSARAGAPAGRRWRQPAARRLLRLAHQAAGHVPYWARQVTILWHRGETTATVTREYHSGDGRLRVETLMPLRERGRVVVDDGHSRWQYEPRHHALYRYPAQAISAGPSVDQVLKQYVAVVAPRPERIARRWVWRVQLQPRQSGKTVRTMWIDPKTGLVLRYLRSSARGRPLSISHVSSLRLGEPPARLFQRPGPGRIRIVSSQSRPAPLSLAKARARFGVPLPAALPAGYTFADAALLPGKGRPVGHLLYRDGLSAVSLYVGPPGALPYDTGRGKSMPLRGGVGRLQSVQHFYVLSWHGPRADFALVGDASANLLCTLANGTDLTAGARPAPPHDSALRWLLGIALALLGLAGGMLAARQYARRHSPQAPAQFGARAG